MFVINSFVVSAPDTDGDIRLELNAELTNKANETVRMVRSKAVFFSADGTPLDAGGRYDEFVRLDKDDRMEIQPGTPYLKSYLTGPEWSKLSTKIFVTTYKRNFSKLGELTVPSKPSSPVVLKSQLSNAPLDSDVRIVLNVDEDEDGNCRPDWKCVLTNNSAMHISKVVLKAELFDEEDAIIDTNESEAEISANSCEVIDSSFWGITKSQLRGAQLRFSIAIFSPIQNFVASAKATIADDELADDA
jgi:hypothetical protein